MKKFEHTDVTSLHEFTVDCFEKVNSVYLWAIGVREFNEDDNDRRIEFCETLLSLLNADPDLINHLIWSDKVPFSYSQLRDLLCGSEFWSEGVIGSFFFKKFVTGQSYLAMLNDYLYPLFRRLPQRNFIFLMHENFVSGLINEDT